MYHTHIENAKSYKTRQGACKAANTKIPEEVKWIIASNSTGFVPVALLDNKTEFMAGALAHNGIYVMKG